MPFGLGNSPPPYQRVMHVLGDLNMKVILICLDDFIIFSEAFEQHI